MTAKPKQANLRVINRRYPAPTNVVALRRPRPIWWRLWLVQVATVTLFFMAAGAIFGLCEVMIHDPAFDLAVANINEARTALGME